MLSLLLTLTLAAPPAPRLAYEAKCLYCHSAELTESRRLSEAGWRSLIEKMRLKAPLLISRSDVPRLARFMTGTLKLTPRSEVKPLPPPHEVRPPVVEAPPPPPVPDEVPPDEPAAVPEKSVDPEQVALEQEAGRLIERRCSKCHTLGRVYGKLDTLERSLTTLERMRFKTGSGITDRELELLQRYLRAQFN